MLRFIWANMENISCLLMLASFEEELRLKVSFHTLHTLLPNS